MANVADLAAGAAGAGALLGIALAVIATIAYRRTRSHRNLFLASAFVVLGLEAGLTGYLLQLSAEISSLWLVVPVAHAIALVLMYVALLRV